ncbi:MAG: GNAT family N-acetyltransferase [Candidatus Omnitrophota bacterium]
MNKKFLNFLIRLQKKQNELFDFIVFFNDLIMKLMLNRRQKALLKNYYSEFTILEKKYYISILRFNRLGEIYQFFNLSFNNNSANFFLPHKTDLKSLKKIFRRISYVPLGIFYEDTIIGYALIRLFFPCVASYFISIANQWQGKGIGTAALERQLALINILNFQPYSMVNKNNLKSIKMLKKLNIEFGKDLGAFFEVKDRVGANKN